MTRGRAPIDTTRPHSVCWRRPIAQPTTRRLNASTVAARYSGRVAVGTSVMSETHSWFGAEAENSRFTRSGAGRRSAFRMVVRNFRRRVTPVSPCSRISRATRFRLTEIPEARSSARTRGAPYTPRLAACASRTASDSSRSSRARREGCRRSQA